MIDPPSRFITFYRKDSTNLDIPIRLAIGLNPMAAQVKPAGGFHNGRPLVRNQRLRHCRFKSDENRCCSIELLNTKMKIILYLPKLS